MRNIYDFIGSINFNNFKIRTKLLIMAVLICLIPIVILSWLNISSSANEIEREVFKENQLYTALTNERIHQYFYTREVDAALMAGSQTVSEGIEKLNSFNMSENEQDLLLKHFDDYLNIALQKYQYTDIFLTNKYGEVAFSISYDKLDIAPLVFSGDFCNKAMGGEQNWTYGRKLNAYF